MSGVGVDTVCRARIARDIAAWGAVFVDRVLTEAERATWPSDDTVRVAGAVALKEATYKACGPYDHRVGWHDVHIVDEADSGDVGDVIGGLARVVASATGAEVVGFFRCAVPSVGAVAYAAWAVGADDVVAVATVAPAS